MKFSQPSVTPNSSCLCSTSSNCTSNSCSSSSFSSYRLQSWSYKFRNTKRLASHLLGKMQDEGNCIESRNYDSLTQDIPMIPDLVHNALGSSKDQPNSCNIDLQSTLKKTANTAENTLPADTQTTVSSTDTTGKPLDLQSTAEVVAKGNKDWSNRKWNNVNVECNQNGGIHSSENPDRMNCDEDEKLNCLISSCPLSDVLNRTNDDFHQKEVENSQNKNFVEKSTDQNEFPCDEHIKCNDKHLGSQCFQDNEKSCMDTNQETKQMLLVDSRFTNSQDVLGTYESSQEMVFEAFTITKEESAEWGWFADVDSSTESVSRECSLTSLRKRYTLENGTNREVLCDEDVDSRVSAALKTFTLKSTSSSSEEVSVAAAIAIPKFRVVQAASGGDRHAEYLVTFKLGNSFYCSWKRHSEFISLVKNHLSPTMFSRALHAWEAIETRWFNRLELSYIHQKCIQLENFIRELMYESNEPGTLIEFLGGDLGIINCRPGRGGTRPSAQLPKDLRPKQPTAERELFERMYEENFRRSSVNYGESITVA